MPSLEALWLIEKAFSNFNIDLRIELSSGGKPSFDAGSGNESNGDKTPDEIFTTLFSEWLRFYGPITKEKISRVLGIGTHDLQPLLDSLADSNDVITGNLIAGSQDMFFCDSEKL